MVDLYPKSIWPLNIKFCPGVTAIYVTQLAYKGKIVWLAGCETCWFVYPLGDSSTKGKFQAIVFLAEAK
jgi:hypothetical protein